MIVLLDAYCITSCNHIKRAHFALFLCVFFHPEPDESTRSQLDCGAASERALQPGDFFSCNITMSRPSFSSSSPYTYFSSSLSSSSPVPFNMPPSAFSSLFNYTFFCPASPTCDFSLMLPLAPTVRVFSLPSGNVLNVQFKVVEMATVLAPRLFQLRIVYKPTGNDIAGSPASFSFRCPFVCFCVRCVCCVLCVFFMPRDWLCFLSVLNRFFCGGYINEKQLLKRQPWLEMVCPCFRCLSFVSSLLLLLQSYLLTLFWFSFDFSPLSF